MKVLLLCRSKQHPDHENENAPQIGDIIQMRRVDKTNWDWELAHFTVVKVDLTIPCGDKFKGRDFAGMCNTCKDNDITKCEFQKYISPQFDTGGVAEEPRILKKRRYKAVYYPPQAIADKINLTTSKTAEDRADILTWALDNEQTKTIITDKK